MLSGPDTPPYADADPDADVDADPDVDTDPGADAGRGGVRAAWCPGGAAHAPESVVLGVRSGLDGQVTYLADPVPAAAVLDQVPPSIEPRRILRFASHCVAVCVNRRGGDCTLVERIVAGAPGEAAGSVPRCHLRAVCKWWQQSGVAACRRCPALATRHRTDDAPATVAAGAAAVRQQLGALLPTAPDPHGT